MNKWWVHKLKSKDPVFIYALIDPRTDKVFYIGKTRSKPRDRMNSHVSEAMRGDKSKRSVHIRQIISRDERPSVLVIETTTLQDYKTRERYWISEYRRQGYQLDNSDNGGGGML